MHRLKSCARHLLACSVGEMMRLVGEAVAFGAVSVVSALATGRGAAMGINLFTRARVELQTQTDEIEARILPGRREDTRLIAICVKRVLRHFQRSNLGALVHIHSNIPIARGLKSSSAASNVLVLATTRALGQSIRMPIAISLGVDASWEAGVTKTGAFDDACASMLGGVVITDNRRRRLIRRYVVPKSNRMRALMLVPAKKRFTGRLHVNKSGFAREMSGIAFEEARSGNWATAMTLNGIVQSASYGLDLSPAVDAIRAGAVSAGLSGKGPATATIVRLTKLSAVKSALKRHAGRVIEARINNQGAHILS